MKLPNSLLTGMLGVFMLGIALCALWENHKTACIILSCTLIPLGIVAAILAIKRALDEQIGKYDK